MQPSPMLEKSHVDRAWLYHLSSNGPVHYRHREENAGWRSARGTFPLAVL